MDRVALNRLLALTVFALLSFANVAPVVAQTESSCPIPVDQQLKSIAAFAEMLPVFRHARCINCHGAVDPLSDAHRGADQLDPALDRFAQRDEFNAQCQECHDQLPGWSIPGEPVFFTGKSDEELCMQMKRFEREPGRFVGHIRDDNGGIQFIAAGFAGDRALDAQALRDYDLTIEKPPGTQAELTAKAQRWVDTIGEGYSSSPECGCVLPTFEGEFKQVEKQRIQGGAANTATVEQVITVSGALTWAPEESELPHLPTFGEVPSRFFVPTEGTITVDLSLESSAPLASCDYGGRQTFAIAQLPEIARTYLALELAADGRYRLSLGLRSGFLPIRPSGSCRMLGFVPVGIADELNDAAIMIGFQTGTLSRDGIVGQLDPPMSLGPTTTVTGSWSFKAKESSN